MGLGVGAISCMRAGVSGAWGMGWVECVGWAGGVGWLSVMLVLS